MKKFKQITDGIPADGAPQPTPAPNNSGAATEPLGVERMYPFGDIEKLIVHPVSVMGGLALTKAMAKIGMPVENPAMHASMIWMTVSNLAASGVTSGEISGLIEKALVVLRESEAVEAILEDQEKGVKPSQEKIDEAIRARAMVEFEKMAETPETGVRH